MRGTPAFNGTRTRTRFRIQSTQMTYTPGGLTVKSKFGNTVFLWATYGNAIFTLGDAVTLEMQSNTYAIADNFALYSDIYFA